MNPLRLLATACGTVAVAGLATVAAQTPQTPGSPAMDQKPARQEITAVGCLKAATGGGMDQNSPSTNSPGATAGYILTSAQLTTGEMDRESASTEPASGSTVQQGMSSAGSTFHLTPASATLNLSPHLNQKVEVKGTLEGATGMRSSNPAEGTAGTISGSNANRPQKLTVSSVKMLSSTCS